MARGGRAKRKAHEQEDDIVLSLSDVERGRLPIRVDYTIENVSEDRRRVIREPRTTHAKTANDEPQASTGNPSATDYFFDLAAIGIVKVVTSGKQLDGLCSGRNHRIQQTGAAGGGRVVVRATVLVELGVGRFKVEFPVRHARPTNILVWGALTPVRVGRRAGAASTAIGLRSRVGCRSSCMRDRREVRGVRKRGWRRGWLSGSGLGYAELGHLLEHLVGARLLVGLCWCGGCSGRFWLGGF